MDSIREVIQPITQNLPAPVQELGITLLGEKCYKTLLLDIDVTSTECIKLGISKGLGLGIIAASSIVKVPQILKLISSGSAAGVSFLSYLLETGALLVGLAYNKRQENPFSTYGENALILAQNVVIAVLVLNYTGKPSAAALFVAGLAASAYALFSNDILDMPTLYTINGAAATIGVASKLPQILANWQQGSTGVLSAVTVFSYLAGSLSRIFTTLQEVDDNQILYGFIAGFGLNVILAMQMLYYWNVSAKKSLLSKKQPLPVAPSAGTTTATPKGKSPTTRRRG
ncbi:hypothetical protein HYALB_00009373 [Hymenoscyphus albidus]|uniref:Mannose-P-dolichol utilization defect 1 protein homolog n=1 Tax=Hymenoscyphus albidus TaxID=595503 RepID=A0A9N9LD75_9HELO|nr:hypothetical protein HYALB_00009373 [Hymenoscyphus albidus]